MQCIIQHLFLTIAFIRLASRSQGIGNPGIPRVGSTLSPTMSDPSVILEGLIWDNAMNYLFSHNRPKLYNDGTIHMNVKYPLDCLIIFEDLLSYIIIVIYALLITYQ